MFMRYKITLPDFSVAPVRSGSVLRWMLYFLAPYKKLFLFLTLNRLGRQIFFAGIEPFCVAKLIEMFEKGTAYQDPSKVWFYLAAFGVLSGIIFLLLGLCTEEARLYDRVSRSARLLGLEHLDKLSVQWHEQIGSGSKLQKIMNGSTGFKNLLRLYFLSLLAVLASCIGTAIAVFGMALSSTYALLFIGFIITYISVAWYTGNIIERGYDTQNQYLETLVGKVYEFVNATTTVKIFNLGRHILSAAQKGEQEGYEQISRVYAFDYARWIVLNFIGFFWTALITGLAISDALDHAGSVTALAFAAYQALNVWNRCEDFTGIYTQIVQESSAAHRLIDILRIPAPTNEARTLPFEKGDITFNNVRFSYNTGKTVLDGFELTIHAGEKVGIVGHSGSGKSTLVKLLLRFYDPDENEITIDRQNLRLIDPESLRQNIAVIPQDVTLFNHSIMENIRYGRLDATDEEVIDAAKHAHAHGFIKNFPDGYNTIIGESGSRLSGGQRQRIAIARAILKKAPILILDEATSALDSESEELIQASLMKLVKDRTVVAIAHRLSTVTMMDTLVVMDSGHIVETGTHQELILKDGIYKRLWEAQNHGFLSSVEDKDHQSETKP